jgi:autotransporter-associated beta strand protein
LPEGADLTDSLLGTEDSAILTYQAGLNHHSVGLLIHGPLSYTGTQAANNFVLRQIGANLDLFDNNVLVASQPLALTTRVKINVVPGADASLTIDYSGGQFTIPVAFDGGTGGGTHTLALQNGAFTSETISDTGTRGGTIQLDSQTVAFSNVTALADTVAKANLTFNLPAASQGTLGDDASAGNGVSSLVSTNAAFVATTTFVDPTASLSVNGGGSSVIQAAPLDTAFTAPSLTFGGQASDSFKLTSAAALPGADTVTINGAALDLNGANPTVAGLAGNGTVTNTTAATATLTVGFQNGSANFAGAIAGAVALTKIGAGVQTLSGQSSYTGATTISAGVLKVGAAGALSASSDITDNALLDLAGHSTSAGALAGSGLVSNSASTGAVLTVGVNGHSAGFAGALVNGAGSIGLAKIGAGVQTLSGGNVYTGPTSINAGTLQLGAANAFSPGSDVNDAGTLDMHGFAASIGALGGNGKVTNSGAAAILSVGADGNSGNFSGAIANAAGAIAFTKIGAGVQTLTGANSYSGLTTISAGTLQLGNSAAIPSTSDVVDNAILDLNHFSDAIGALSGSGVVTNNGAIAGVLSVGGNGRNGAFAGALQDGLAPVGLTKTGSGTQVLSGAANTYSGPTVVAAGVLQAGGSNSFSTNSDINVAATLDLHGNVAAVGALTGTGIVTTMVAGSATVAFGADGNSATFAGAFKNGSGVLGVAKVGAGVETLTGLAHTYTGVTAVTAGTLTLNDTLYAATFGVVNLNGPGAALNGTGVVRGQVLVSATGASIDGVTVTTRVSGRGVVVAPGADQTHIGLTKGIVVNGGNANSIGIVVNGGAEIVNSTISGHNIDVLVDGGSALLQGNKLNVGTGAFATGLQVQNGGIVDAGQLQADATPLPAGPVNNVGFYGDITGQVSGTPLGSIGHSIGGNTFNGYTLSAAAANPNVPQAIRDLNTSAAPFGALANGVETGFTYGGPHFGRMDVTARNNTFNNLVNAPTATIQKLVFDSHRQTGLGYVVYGLPTLTISQTPPPPFVPPGSAYSVLITYTNTGVLPTFGALKIVLSAGQAFDASLNPGWVNQGNNVVTFDLGLLQPGATGVITFTASVIPLPPVSVLSLTTYITPDPFTNLNVGTILAKTTTTPLGKKARLV